ncbi:MAG: tetratricopeptide repeat protein [Candidatus Poribacteria bacterium]|nr:tetratricopeptide repeat protein [Candidatus Poribacteria bacterium]
MLRHLHLLAIVYLLCFIFSTLYFPLTANSQDEASDEKIIERYKLMLNRKPKEGSTFDRLYQFYLEGAGLDAMLSDYQADAQAKPNDSNLQLILGHIYKRLGKDTEAIAAYQRAVELAPENYYPHFALGKMYGTLRQHEEAIQALTQAAAFSEQAQDIPPEELTGIYKALGHAYFRRDRVDEAIQAWQKISELDPQDIFARIELADLFREQELYQQAIAQHEAIIQLKKDDPYRICLSHREIGNIHEAKGDYQDAIKSFDAALALTAPGNWLRKDLQHRIIGIFAADSNWGGLIEYYQARLEATPNEPELLGLLAAAYIENQQLEEGISTYRKGLELAPTDTNLRLNLIASLRNAEKFAEAAAEYEVLSEQDPDDFGIYRELGELYLQLGNQDKAKAVYQKMIDRDPNNPSTHLILAEIYTGHEWIEDAVSQYEKAISLAPHNLDYIEYFGEFYFRQANREKALETWNRMVADENATAENYDRLAQLLKTKNFKAEAVAASRKAVELMPNEYRYREALAKHLMEDQVYDKALTEYTAAMELAPNEFFAEKMDDKRIELYRRQGTLVDKIEALETELKKPGLADAEMFAHQKQLVKMYLKLGNITYALEVLLSAKQRKPDDISINRWIAQVYTRQGRRDEANATYMHLIEVDSANAREYHANIAESYLNVMDFDAATAAAKQVIAHSPRNPEGHELLAQIAKQSRNYETAIDSLKQAIRLRPEAIDTRSELAATYKLSGKLQQALAQYWRCWDLSDNVSDKLTFVKPLSEVYYDLGRRGDFEEKLKQLAKSNTGQVAPVLALAELHRMEGDLSSARFQLAQALNKQRENPELLSHLAQISVELGEIQEAVAYQQRLVKADPNLTHQQRLGELLFDAGREQEAIQAWTKLLHAKNQTLEAEVKLASLLLRHGLSEDAFLVLDRAAEKITGTDAHIPLYRLGAMLVGMNESERARPYFHRILDMSEPLENITKQWTKQSSIYASSTIPGVDYNKFDLSRTTIREIQSKPTLSGSGIAWVPKTFEEAQAGALVHLTTIAQQHGKLSELVQQFEADADANPTDIKTLETLARLYTLIQHNDKAKRTIDKLIEISPNDLAYQPLRLHRSIQENANYETLKKLLDDIPGLVPEARYRYIAEYAKMLYRDEKEEDASKLLSEVEEVKVADFNTGYALVDAFHLIEKTDIAERILLSLPKPPQAQQYQYRQLFEKLTDSYIEQAEPEKAIELFWIFCERTKPTGANPRRVDALARSSSYYYGYRPVQTTYPTPIVYFNSQRLNYLKSVFREFWIREQQGKLFTKFQKELDAAEGRDRIYPSLAMSYCYWWDEERDKAQEILSSLQKDFPDDLTLKLNAAIVSIQTGKFRDAFMMLEDLAEAEPRNRRQYNDLLLQLAIHTGDTVKLRELMAKLLNSPTGTQELYQFSQNLQDAGFTQYAIAAGKKAMVLAMTQRNANFLMELGEHLSDLGRGQDAALLAERALRFTNRPDRYGRMMYAYNFRRATNLVSRSKDMQERENLLIAEVEKNPKSYQTQIKLAIFYESANKIEKAAEAFKAALALRPNDSSIRLRYVRMLERNSMGEEALPEYTILLKNNSTALGYDYRKAIDAFVSAGKLDDLIALTKDIIMPVGQYAGSDLTVEVGRRCLAENRPQPAIEIFQKILEVHPKWDYVHRDLASAYVAAGEPEKAIQYLTEKHEIGKTSLSQTAFQLKIAEYHEAAGGRESAIQYLQEKTETGDLSNTQSTVVLKLAEYYEVSGELEQFITEYEAKLAEDPSNTKLLYLLASMKIKANDIEGANLHINALIDDALLSVETKWLYNLADVSEKAGVHDLQFRLLEAVAEKLENQNSWALATSYEKLGEAYIKKEEMEKAQNAFRKMGTIQTMRDSSRSTYEKRQLASKYMQYEMWDDAETLYTEVINDLSASSWERESAQEQFMEIKQRRGDLNSPQFVEKIQEMGISMQRAIAQEFAQRNQVEKALEIFERISETMPEDLESRAQLAKLYSRKNEHDKASETWQILLESDPENTKYQDGLVNSFHNAGKLEQALGVAQQYVEAEPEVGVHYVRLAKLYSDEDRKDEAIAAYEKAIELAPGDRNVYLKVAELYFLNDDIAATEEAYKNAIQYTPNEWNRRGIERQLMNLYRYQGNLEEMLQKAEDEGTLTLEMEKERANYYLSIGELEKSAEAYKTAFDMTTDSYDKNRISSDLFKVYIKLGKTNSVLEIYEKAIQANPTGRLISYGSSSISARPYADRARDNLINAYKDQGKLEDLQALFEGKLQENPENSKNLKMMAKIFWSREDFNKSAEVYQTLSLTQPNDVLSLYNAGAALNRSGQIGLAKEMFNKASTALESSSDKDDMWFIGTLATICLENKIYDQAIELAEAALVESRSYGGSSVQETLHEMLGKSYRETKRYEEAVNAYRQMANVARYDWPRERAETAIEEIAREGKLYEKWIPEQLKKVEANPENANLRLKLAQNYEATNRVKEAVEQYEKISKLQPENSQWFKKLGEFYDNMPIKRHEAGESVEGTALNLNGNRSFVEIDESESINQISGQVTVSAWIKPTNFPNEYFPIVSKTDEWDSDFKKRSFFLNLKGDGSIQFAASPDGEDDASIYSPKSIIELNTWHYIAGVVDTETDIIKLFVDGIQVNQRDFKGKKRIYQSKFPLRIGWSYEEVSAHKSFVGQIDEVRVWNVARTEQQIRADMNTQLNGDEPGLVGYWKFDAENQGVIADATQNRNDGKLIGNATFEPYTRPIFESSREERLVQVIAAYQKAIELEPTSYQHYDLLAKFYVKTSQTSDAEAVYRQALDASLTQDNHNSAIKAISDLYAKDGQESKRIAILEEIKPDMEKSAVLHELLGDLYKKTGDSEKTDLAYAEWLKIRQKETEGQQSASNYRNFAEELLNKERFPEIALIFAKRALQSYTGSYYYYPTTLGDACIANGLFEDALIHYKHALSIVPSGYSTEQFWKRVAEAGKKANDKEGYSQMLSALINTIPSTDSSNHANAYRMLAQFYSDTESSEYVENNLLSKTGFVPEIRWITLGPFKSIDSYGYENSYIPEETTQIDTTAKYYGRDGLISWKKTKYRSLDGHYVFVGDNDASAAYVWAVVISPDEREITFRFDSDDQGVIWLNGKRVFSHDRTSGTRLDRYTVPVTLKQGENTILMKICNSTQSWDFFLRLTDAEGNPFEDLKFKTADELLNAPPPEPTFHVNVNLGMAEYYSKNNMPEKAMEQMQQNGIVQEDAWWVLGPFDNTAGIGYNTAYISEDITQIDTTAKYEGVGGQLSWKKFTDDAFDGFIDFGRNVNWRVAYTFATVTSPDERQVQFRFGSDDQAKLWLNGKEVFARANAGWVVLDRDIIPVTLKAGKNTILVKVCNEELSWGFYFRITDADGKPFEDLHINNAQVD